MAHYGILRDYRFSDQSADDIRGAHIYGVNDEKLGKIDDVIFDHASGDIRYVVVDTGGWLSSNKFLVPTERIQPSTKHKDDYQVDLTKQQIETFPPYKESDLQEEKSWGDYEHRYRSKWVVDPVMHREATDRNITPTTQQMPRASVGSGGSALADEAAAEADTGRVIPAGRDTVTISSSAVGIGGRWDTFQSRLRERRKQAVLGCKSCSTGPASARDMESADTARKAI
jgi:sporulation protein YlmC with PRC-barrel domain